MAQYFTDFTEYTLGDFPADWLPYSDNLGYGDESFLSIIDKNDEGIGASGQAIKYDVGVNTGNSYRAARWNLIPVVENMEVLMRVRLTESVNCECQATVRSDLGSSQTWYQGGPRSGGDLDINKRVNASFSNLNNDTTKDWIAENNWQWTRFRIAGENLYLKAWMQGEQEPPEWDVTDADTDILSGGAGFTTVRDRVFYIDQYSVGTNGDSAPFTPGGGGDTISPVITLNGDNPLILNVGETYSEPGAFATDNADGTIPFSSFTVTGTVDTSSAGTYAVDYDVADAEGNQADTATRQVVVQDAGVGSKYQWTGAGETVDSVSTLFTPEWGGVNSDWEVQSDATAHTDGTSLAFVGTVDARRFMRLNAAAQGLDPATDRVDCRFRFYGNLNDGTLSIPRIFASSPAGSENALYADIGRFNYDIRLIQYHDDNSEILASNKVFSSEAGWFQGRMLWDPTDTDKRWKISVWRDSDSQPFAWDFEVNPTFEPKVGDIGFGTFNAVTHKLDWITFGTGGADAENLSPDGGGPIGSGDLTFYYDFDNGNIDSSQTSVIGADTGTPAISFQPRAIPTVFKNDVPKWRHFLLKIDGLLNKRPEFSFSDSDYWSTVDTNTWRPWYSYDNVNWFYWDSAPSKSGSIVSFQRPSAFTQDTVYIAFNPAYPVERSADLINWFDSNHPQLIHSLPSTDANYINSTMDDQTDEQGRTIPGQPIYGYGVWDDALYVDQGSKRTIVLCGSLHPGESPSNHILENWLTFLAGGTAEATSLLEKFHFLVYPVGTPMGVWGGNPRRDWHPDQPDTDTNRDWFEDKPPAHESNLRHHNMFQQDFVGRTICAMFDFHGSTIEELGGMFFIYGTRGEPEPVDRFSAALNQYDNYRVYSGDLSAVGSDLKTSYFKNRYNTDLTFTVEYSELLAHPNGYQEFVDAGHHLAKALNDTSTDNPADFGMGVVIPINAVQMQQRTQTEAGLIENLMSGSLLPSQQVANFQTTNVSTLAATIAFRVEQLTSVESVSIGAQGAAQITTVILEQLTQGGLVSSGMVTSILTSTAEQQAQFIHVELELFSYPQSVTSQQFVESERTALAADLSLVSVNAEQLTEASVVTLLDGDGITVVPVEQATGVEAIGVQLVAAATGVTAEQHTETQIMSHAATLVVAAADAHQLTELEIAEVLGEALSVNPRSLRVKRTTVGFTVSLKTH